MPIKRCKASFTVFVNGSPRMYNVGTLVDADDPVVKGREALFEDADTYVARRSDVEQATAEPGTRRSLSRPRKSVPKRATPKAAMPKPESQSPDDQDGSDANAGDSEEDPT